MISGIAHTALIVHEYDEAKQFYCEKLGFIVAEDTQLTNGKRWIRLRPPGGGQSEILLSRAVNSVQRQSVGNQTGGRVLLFLYTTDFDADYKLFLSKGVEFTEGPHIEKYGKVAVFKDLYGNRVDLIEKPRSHLQNAKEETYFPQVTIRSAMKSDAEGIAERLSEFGYPTTPVQVVNRLDDFLQAGAIALVAIQDNAVVGVITAQRNSVLHRSDNDARITSLEVAASARNNGVGRLLLEEVEKWGRRTKCGRIEVTSGTARIDAHHFYLKRGYEQTSLRFSKSLNESSKK